MSDEAGDPSALAAAFRTSRRRSTSGAVRVTRRACSTCSAGSSASDRSTRVLDLAAGTGKLTRLLVALGASTSSPSSRWPRCAPSSRRVVPQAELLDGTAESIPLADGSVDVVTVAQAFHWFDAQRALDEIARVLRPGGSLLLVWNEGDHRDPVTNEVLRVMRTAGGRPETIERDWRIVLDDSGRFEPARRGRFRWRASVTHAEALDAIESRSYVSVLPDEQRAVLLDDARRALAQLPEPFEYAYATEAHWCRRPSGTPPS